MPVHADRAHRQILVEIDQQAALRRRSGKRQRGDALQRLRIGKHFDREVDMLEPQRRTFGIDRAARSLGDFGDRRFARLDLREDRRGGQRKGGSGEQQANADRSLHQARSTAHPPSRA
ncbi:hypothetical protein PIB19_05845 [Sphingomonas sp. 7/4-4]|uniref:hypothetical protein n=1 Tax=Sphingomonas sp. 7/4-4 TaxID=3018446 RepID=UPI0022F3EB96|nr:hypothetical protein [Sphingomonas sp. 7/4-4]WBY09988.1 hypothetical protein PIB19_05845 [Sphingomonas sp. 7/4-4]